MKISKIALALATLMLSTSLFAKDKASITEEEGRRYPVSAKAGVVNYIAGYVTWNRNSYEDPLAAGKELLVGDVLKTHQGTFAEVLLNPGSFVRLSENSEFTFHDKATNSLKVGLGKGSAVIEASVVIGRITVVTPASEYAITRAGLYRFTVGEGDATSVVVRKGRVEVSGKAAGAGKKIALSAGAPVITSLGNQGEDLFEVWSRRRSASLIVMGHNLPANVVQHNLAASQIPALWVYSPAGKTFVFAAAPRLCVVSPYGLPSGTYGGGALEAWKTIKEYNRIDQRAESLRERFESREVRQ